MSKTFLRVDPDGTATPLRVDAKRNGTELAALQEAVGGLIEYVAFRGRGIGS